MCKLLFWNENVCCLGLYKSNRETCTNSDAPKITHELNLVHGVLIKIVQRNEKKTLFRKFHSSMLWQRNNLDRVKCNKMISICIQILGWHLECVSFCRKMESVEMWKHLLYSFRMRLNTFSQNYMTKWMLRHWYEIRFGSERTVRLSYIFAFFSIIIFRMQITI